jgi:16S rRNA processing protein RimM
VVGHLNKAHGTKGELFVWPLTDHPESAFAPGVVLCLGDEAASAPDPSLPGLVIEAVRPFRRGFLLRVEGVADRIAAEALQGRYVMRAVEELEELAEGEVFYHQLLGMRVVTEGGEEVGKIVEVYELRPADLLEVRGPRGTCHIPFLASFVRRLDPVEGVLVIAPPEGLLDL